MLVKITATAGGGHAGAVYIGSWILPELPSPGGMIDQNTESIENSNTKNNLAKYKTKLDSVKNGQDRESSARRRVPPQASSLRRNFVARQRTLIFWS